MNRTGPWTALSIWTEPADAKAQLSWCVIVCHRVSLCEEWSMYTRVIYTHVAQMWP